jgi:transglutaminase/protease-like cytokinesis protein 3
MKFLLTIFYCCLFQCVWSQGLFNFSSADGNKKKIKEENLEALAHQLTANCNTDLEKTRSIFKWITENISYNTLIFQKISKHSASSKTFIEVEDTSMTLKPLDIRVAESVLKRRLAICDGYSRLFKALCDLSGIKSEIIIGYARSNWTRVGTRFYSNHTWNAVLINNKWHLLDVTWASGYLNYSDEFIKQYNDFYFLTPPEEFILDHYPEKIEWTLLKEPPSIQEFRLSPFKSQAFIKNRIQKISPSSGIIEAALGDTISIELEANDYNKKLIATPNPQMEIGIAHPVFTFFHPNSSSIISGQKTTYHYIIHAPIKWLHVIYDGEIVMRYKVVIKERNSIGMLKH